MKRYVKSSISESTPKWLREEFSKKWASIKYDFMKKYNVALDRATYTDTPASSESIPIYLFVTDFGERIYCPGVNDDDTIMIDGKLKKFRVLRPSKLAEFADDVTYVDISDPHNTFDDSDRYQDPRYSYKRDTAGEYAGQYRTSRRNRETGDFESTGWSLAGRSVINEPRPRDKSGYAIPTPESRLEEYYRRFPDKVTDKLDAVYQDLISTRQKLFEADFNKPIDDADRYGDVYEDAYRKFSHAVGSYRKLLSLLDENHHIHSYDIQRFAEAVNNITAYLADIREI